MKARSVFACAATGIALMAFGATTASAESTSRSFGISPGDVEDPYMAIGIDDDVIKPGQEVRVAASCQDPRFVSSKVVSPVVTAPDLVRDKPESVNSPVFSMGRIAADAKPGTYPISFTCVDREVTGEFTVVTDSKPVPPKAQVPVKPKGAADTGSLEQPASDDGAGALLIGAGAAALLAAGGTGVWAYRRRQRV